MVDFKDVLYKKELRNPDVSPVKVAELLIEKSATLAVAESITGGDICSTLVKVPGASDFLLGGIVAYSNRIKVMECMVNARTIQRYGAVSSQVCLEMAKGLLHKFQCTFAVSTTGFAGPQREQEKVGLVYIGLVSSNQEVAKQFMFTGERSDIIRQTTFAALDLIRYYASAS